METVAFILYIMIFYPNQNGYDKEMYPIQSPVCVVKDGKKVEDSSCGIKYCISKGRIRAAVIAGHLPGAGFGIICKTPDGKEELKDGAEPSPGHGGLNWRK